jgi:predicted TIM-barrel fold metal-dependent hydrolase
MTTTTDSSSFRVPAGACDTHCHIWGPLSRFPYAPSRPYTPPERDKHALTVLHERLGIERTVIVQAIVYRTDNRVVLDAIADRPHARRGIALIDPDIAEDDLQRLHDGGIRGVRFGFVSHLGSRPDLASFHRTVARIAHYGWHVLLHLDAADLFELGPVFDKLPIPFVIDHMGRIDAAYGVGQPAFARLLELARRENCWIKLSGADRVSARGDTFSDAVPFARALLSAAPERVLWGTDYPHPNARHEVVDDAKLVDLLPQFGDAVQLQKLLVDNPARLYGFNA